MKLFALLSLLLSISVSSFAYEVENESGYRDASELEAELASQEKITIKQNDATRLEKFKAALDALGIEEESAPNFTHFPRANESNQAEVEKNLTWIDPDGALARYFSITAGKIQLFRDFFKSMISLNLLEYEQTLSTYNKSNDSDDLMLRLERAAAQTQAKYARPLQGLKILIDPGHVGGEDWDVATGKYVKVGSRVVREGNLTLWTALLTAQKLENLGATVKLTRDSLSPVAREDRDHFDAAPYITNYFQSSIDNWMAPYLEKLSIDEIRKTITSKPEVKDAYDPKLKIDKFYVNGADLEARAQMIDQFKPDITLDIHFDAANTGALQSTTQSLEAFVPGAFGKTETGARKSKAYALEHALEVRRWNQSVELADVMTQSMSTALNIPRLSQPKFLSSVRVRDGVYARNLYITRRALDSLVVYLECLHYDHVKEHKALSITDRTGKYRGMEFKYPKRLDTISESISNGLIEYFKNLK